MEFLDLYRALKYISLVVLVLVLCYILRVIIGEIVTYFLIKSYSKVPGVATYYFPFMGFVAFILKGDKNDILKGICNMYKQNSDKHMVITHGPDTKLFTVLALLISSDATKEF